MERHCNAFGSYCLYEYVNKIINCYSGGTSTIRLLRQRFHENYTDSELHDLIDRMVEQSRDSLTTRLYDNFQYFTNGIL